MILGAKEHHATFVKSTYMEAEHMLIPETANARPILALNDEASMHFAMCF